MSGEVVLGKLDIVWGWRVWGLSEELGVDVVGDMLDPDLVKASFCVWDYGPGQQCRLLYIDRFTYLLGCQSADVATLHRSLLVLLSRIHGADLAGQGLLGILDIGAAAHSERRSSRDMVACL